MIHAAAYSPWMLIVIIPALITTLIFWIAACFFVMDKIEESGVERVWLKCIVLGAGIGVPLGTFMAIVIEASR